MRGSTPHVLTQYSLSTPEELNTHTYKQHMGLFKAMIQPGSRRSRKWEHSGWFSVWYGIHSQSYCCLSASVSFLLSCVADLFCHPHQISTRISKWKDRWVIADIPNMSFSLCVAVRFPQLHWLLFLTGLLGCLTGLFFILRPINRYSILHIYWYWTDV